MVEASLVGKLDHPHIAKIFDVVDGPDERYVVMEYVPGGTLERYTREGELMDTDSAVDVVFKAAKALEHVHSLGVVHRDIKPANILIYQGTNIRLSDFGAALTKSLATTQDIKAGSPFYMSPEQISGEALDFRSDMFSLGVVFYELLTGQRPFRASTLTALAYQLATVEPVPPSHIREGIPPHVDALVMRALRKQPAERFASWKEFVHELANEPVSGAEKSASEISLETQTDRYSLVRRCAFFESFDDPNLWEVISNAELRRAVEGDVIMREGEIGEEFFVILAGQVRVTKRGRLIDVMGPGVSFGELSYILKGKRARNASCVALTDAIVLRAADAWLARASPACRAVFESQFLRQMSLRLLEANERIAQG
jgi:serine/threonine protein kinase